MSLWSGLPHVANAIRRELLGVRMVIQRGKLIGTCSECPPMSRNETLKRLSGEIANIARLEEGKLLRRPDKWGDEFDLTNAGRSIRIALKIANELDGLPLQELPEAVAENMAVRLGEIGGILTRIKGYSVAQSDTRPIDFKNEVETGLRDQIELFLNEVGLWLTFLKVDSRDDEKLREEAKSIQTEMKGLLNDAKVQRQSTNEEIKSILESLRQASGEAGVSVHAHHFAKEVGRLSWVSWIWLGVTGFLMAALVLFLWAYAPEIVSAGASSAQMAGAVSTKLSIAAVLLTSVLWCGRMYKAVEHRRAVNRHKELALKTFKTFVDATDVEQTKDAVLLAATNSIFDNVPTGLVDQKGATKDHPIMQIVDSGKSLKSGREQTAA